MKIAIVGCGALARTFYLPVLSKMGIVPAALVDPSLENIQDLINQYKGVKAVCTPEEIIKDIDAAIIATPNFLHVPQTRLFLDQGKHVLVEKPMSPTVEEGRSLEQLAKKNGAVLQIGMMRRFWKINKAVKKLLEDQVLGDLQSISMEEGSVLNWPVQTTAIFSAKQSLGGVLMDTGSHTLDLLSWWLPHTYDAIEYKDDNKGGVEADCELKLQFKQPAIEANVRLSRIRNMSNSFVITGSNGWIKLKPYANIFEASNKNIENYVHGLYRPEELKAQSFNDLFEEQLVTWIESIRNRIDPAISAASVLPSIHILEQCYKQRQMLTYPWN